MPLGNIVGKSGKCCAQPVRLREIKAAAGAPVPLIYAFATIKVEGPRGSPFDLERLRAGAAVCPSVATCEACDMAG